MAERQVLGYSSLLLLCVLLRRACVNEHCRSLKVAVVLVVVVGAVEEAGKRSAREVEARRRAEVSLERRWRRRAQPLALLSVAARLCLSEKERCSRCERHACAFAHTTRQVGLSSTPGRDDDNIINHRSRALIEGY